MVASRHRHNPRAPLQQFDELVQLLPGTPHTCRPDQPLASGASRAANSVGVSRVAVPAWSLHFSSGARH